jgi:hypothetical protein
MMDKLTNWIISRKDGSGGFKRNPQALDTFGSAPDNITNAYIVWSLINAGITDVDDEIAALIEIADESIANDDGDAYFLGLLSASLY